MSFWLRNFLILWLLFSFISVDTSGQQVGFYFEKNRKKLSLPFEVHNNLIVVSVTINGEYPSHFILDTGVRPTILIDKALADSIGLKYQRRIELFGVGNANPVDALVAGGVTLSMKGVKSENHSVLVLEQNLLELERHLGTRIHGILGYDFFSRFVVKINYQKGKIVLYEPPDFQVSKKFNTIDLTLINSKPHINLELEPLNADKISVELLADTGASHALVLNRNSSEEIQLPDKFIDVNLGRSIAGEISGKLCRISSLTLSNNQLNDVIVSFVNEEPPADASQQNGALGGELLRKFTVIFDYYHNKLYLKPNKSFRDPFEYNMSGLEFIAEGKQLNRYVISAIRENSAADKQGFMPGDVVISLNNLSSKKLSLSRIYSVLHQKEGNQVTLTVYRKGSYISRSFYLKKEI